MLHVKPVGPGNLAACRLLQALAQEDVDLQNEVAQQVRAEEGGGGEGHLFVPFLNGPG